MAFFPFKWSGIAGIALSKAGRVTIVAPFIGHYLILNDAVFDYLSFVDDASRNISLFGYTYNLRQGLILTYLGSFLMGIGIIVYQIFRPAEFKQFNKANAFISDEFPHSTEESLEALRGLWAANVASVNLNSSRPSTVEIGTVDIDLDVDKRNKRAEIYNLLRTCFDNADIDNPIARTVSSILILTSLVLLFLPSLFTFIAVVKRLFTLFT